MLPYTTDVVDEKLRRREESVEKTARVELHTICDDISNIRHHIERGRSACARRNLAVISVPMMKSFLKNKVRKVIRELLGELAARRV